MWNKFKHVLLLSRNSVTIKIDGHLCVICTNNLNCRSPLVASILYIAIISCFFDLFQFTARKLHLSFGYLATRSFHRNSRTLQHDDAKNFV